jgi:hypothetical protein
MMWIQHAVVLAAVGGCAAFLARCGIKSLFGGKCASGCGGCSASAKKPTAAKTAAAKPAVHFVPVEMLARKK